MPRYIAKLANNEYVEWSTVVDAPATFIMTRDNMLKHLKTEYGIAQDHEARLKRADEQGTSAVAPPLSLRDLLVANRAGDKEEYLTLDQIRVKYHIDHMDDSDHA